MAHFAELDNNNVVLQVVVIDNNDTLDENGNESEAVGIAFCQSLFGADKIFKQTSYNNNFRKFYAGIGYIYRSDLDAFIEPQPYPSWTLNTETCIWEAPTPVPTDLTEEEYDAGTRYVWNEDNQTWNKESI